jgi:hypothetical protein
MSTSQLFRPRKRRVARFGRYSGLPVEILLEKANGMILVSCGDQRFSVYADELVRLQKPIHGSPGNYRFNRDGSLRTFDNDDSR